MFTSPPFEFKPINYNKTWKEYYTCPKDYYKMGYMLQKDITNLRKTLQMSKEYYKEEYILQRNIHINITSVTYKKIKIRTLKLSLDHPLFFIFFFSNPQICKLQRH